MQIDTDEREVIERVAALDVGKAEVVCCVRVPGPRGQRMQEVRTVTTMTAALFGLADWLASLGVTRENRCETWLVIAKDVKHLPGRPRPIGWTPSGCARSRSGRC